MNHETTKADGDEDMSAFGFWVDTERDLSVESMVIQETFNYQTAAVERADESFGARAARERRGQDRRTKRRQKDAYHREKRDEILQKARAAGAPQTEDFVQFDSFVHDKGENDREPKGGWGPKTDVTPQQLAVITHELTLEMNARMLENYANPVVFPSTTRFVIFLDDDNGRPWESLYYHFREFDSFPKCVFWWIGGGAHEGKSRRTFPLPPIPALWEAVMERRIFISACMKGRDAADKMLIQRAAWLHTRVPKEIPFWFLTADKGFKTGVQHLESGGRRSKQIGGRNVDHPKIYQQLRRNPACWLPEPDKDIWASAGLQPPVLGCWPPSLIKLPARYRAEGPVTGYAATIQDARRLVGAKLLMVDVEVSHTLRKEEAEVVKDVDVEDAKGVGRGRYYGPSITGPFWVLPKGVVQNSVTESSAIMPRLTANKSGDEEFTTEEQKTAQIMESGTVLSATSVIMDGEAVDEDKMCKIS